MGMSYKLRTFAIMQLRKKHAGQVPWIVIITALVGIVSSSVSRAAPQPFAWAVAGNGNGDDFALAVATDALGNSYLTGQSGSSNLIFGSTILTNAGNRGVFMGKFDKSGSNVWANSIGQLSAGLNTSRGLGVAADGAGNSYFTGVLYGTNTLGGSNLVSSGLSDMFVAKYDANGNLIWLQRAGGTGINDRAVGYRIAMGGSGSLYVAAEVAGTNQLTSAAGTNLTVIGQSMLLVKYDTAGNQLWVKQVLGDVFPEGLATDPTGNLVVAADFGSSTINVGGSVLTNRGDYDAFIAKYDPLGNVLWIVQVGGNDQDQALGVACDSATNAYLACNVNSMDTMINGTPFTDGKGLLAKFSSTGSLVWARGTPWWGKIASDASGQVYMTGEFSTNVVFGSSTLTNAGDNQDIFVCAYDSAGNAQWAKQAGGPNNDVPRGIALDNAYDIYIAGGFQTTAWFDSIGLTNPVTQSDVFVARINGGQPKLAIQRASNQTILAWPASTFGYYLETTNQLKIPLTLPWQAVTNTPTIVGTNLTVTLPMAGSNSFFRLRGP